MADLVLRRGLWRLGRTTFGPADHLVFRVIMLMNQDAQTEADDDSPPCDVRTMSLCRWRLAWTDSDLVDEIVAHVLRRHMQTHPPDDTDVTYDLLDMLDAADHVV